MTYGVLSKLPVSARRVVPPSVAVVAAVSVDATLACAVTCGDGVAAADSNAGVSGVAFADGTNHRAHRRPPRRRRSATDGERMTRNIDPLVALANWPCGQMLVKGAGHRKVTGALGLTLRA